MTKTSLIQKDMRSTRCCRFSEKRGRLSALFIVGGRELDVWREELTATQALIFPADENGGQEVADNEE